MSRTYPELPVCAVGALIFKARQILLVKRGKPPAYGKWSIPGGVVRLGEGLEEAVVREVREETHLIVRPTKIEKVVERIIRDAASRIQYHYVILDYVCEIRGGELQAGSDAQAANFVEVDSLDRLELTEGTSEVIREAYRDLGF
jgi:ADP-ribose pyrophosphatase YjhB (NUDIX family)